jgi:predicted transcriptional regulator
MGEKRIPGHENTRASIPECDGMSDTDVQPVTSGTTDFGTMPGQGSGEVLKEMQEVVFLEPGQEKAQKFIRVISNQNACDVLQLLREAGPLRLSDIAERLGGSLNATKYHIENLMDAGLVEISNTRYSVKGRKVKIYQMKNQIFIVAPTITEKKQIISAVLKYGGVLGVYLIIAVMLIVLVPFTGAGFTVPLTGSLGGPATGSVLLDTSIIASLIIAAAVTILLLIVYEAQGYWRAEKAGSN